jgi:uncharacterized protein (DUF2147 family)
MKKIIFVFTLLFIGIIIYSQSEVDRITGVWLNNLGNAEVEIFKRDGKFFGKIVWIKVPNDMDINLAKDKNNPDPSLRSRKILELEILTDLAYENGAWIDGKLYSPEKGQTVDCKVEISDDNKTLFVKASKGIFSKTLEWKKVDNKQDVKNEN